MSTMRKTPFRVGYADGYHGREPRPNGYSLRLRPSYRRGHEDGALGRCLDRQDELNGKNPSRSPGDFDRHNSATENWP